MALPATKGDENCGAAPRAAAASHAAPAEGGPRARRSSRSCPTRAGGTFGAFAVNRRRDFHGDGRLPSRQHALPVRVHVLAHFRFVVALALRDLVVTLAPPRKLIAIDRHSQPRFVWN